LFRDKNDIYESVIRVTSQADRIDVSPTSGKVKTVWTGTATVYSCLARSFYDILTDSNVLTSITYPITVCVFLTRIGDVGAVVAYVSQTVPVLVQVHQFQDAGLVGRIGAVLAGVTPLVAIGVRLVRVMVIGAVVALVTDAVVVSVLLTAVRMAEAVVAGIAHEIAVVVILPGVRRVGAVVAGVAHAVTVSVLLPGVGNGGAVVNVIHEAVVIHVPLRARRRRHSERSGGPLELRGSVDARVVRAGTDHGVAGNGGIRHLEVQGETAGLGSRLSRGDELARVRWAAGMFKEDPYVMLGVEVAARRLHGRARRSLRGVQVQVLSEGQVALEPR